MLFFIGCEQEPTEEEKALTQLKEDNNILNGGDGNFDNPYKISNGTYGALKSGDFFYSLDLNGSDCSMLFYDYKGYIQPENYALYKVNSSNDKDHIDYNSSSSKFAAYNSLDSSNYLVSVRDMDIPGDMFGVYSSCGSNYDNISSLEDKEYRYTSIQKLYRLKLTSSKNLKISFFQNGDDVYIFDSKFVIINKDNDSYLTDINLVAGTYYILTKSVYSNTETIFDVDINNL